jgi:putative ABC transport system permease protein
MVTPFQSGGVETVLGAEGILDAEARRNVSVRVRLPDGKWDALKLVAFVEPGARRVSAVLPMQGDQDPGSREVVLERKTARTLGVGPGDDLELELSDGTTRVIKVAGVAQDPSAGYDAILGDLEGYISRDSLEWLHETDVFDRIYATVRDQPNNKGYIDHVATEAIERLERAGSVVYSVSLYRRDAHPLRAIIQALMGVLAMLGVLIAFLSGSLISNTMSALLSQHLRQIGVMKLVGARRRQVISMYLVLIMTFGAIALAVAIPAAAWAGRQLSTFVADIINYADSQRAFVPLAVALQCIIALVVPPIAGLMPVLSGSRISIKNALTASGLEGSDAKPTASKPRLRAPSWISRPLLLSIRNTFRRKRRLALTLVTLTLGGAVFISVFNVQESLNLKVNQLAAYFLADVNLDLDRPYRIERVLGDLRTIPDVEHIEVWASAGAEWIREGADNPENVGLLAPPQGSDLLVPVITDGRWLIPGDENAITINEAFLEIQPGLAPGDSLRLKVAGEERDWTVVGVFQYGALDRMLAYAPYGYLSRELGSTSRAAVYRIVTADSSPETQIAVSDAIDARFRELGYDVNEVEPGYATGETVTDLLGILTTVLLVMALLTALVGSIGLAGTMGMNVMERTREIGVLRAIGAHDGVVRQLVLVEGLLIGLISYLLGAALSFPITQALSEIISQAIFNGPANFAFTTRGFLLWALAVAVLSTVASLAPARTATTLTIREVLAYE